MCGKFFFKNSVFPGEIQCHKCYEELIHQRFPLFEKKIYCLSPPNLWGIIRNSELDIHKKHRYQQHSAEWRWFLVEKIWQSSKRKKMSKVIWNISSIWDKLQVLKCFPGGASGKEPACQCRRFKRCSFNPSVRKIPWRRARQPTYTSILA